MAENLGGKSFHWVRKEEGAENDEEEMKAILSDWEQFGDLRRLTREASIQKLIELLRSSAVGLARLADRLTRYVSIADQDVDKALIQGIIKPDEPEYAENLAYEVNADFGDEFKTWQSEDRNRNKGSRVKARQWVQMWHSHLGEAATPAAIIEALEECGGGKDIISSVKKIC